MKKAVFIINVSILLLLLTQNVYGKSPGDSARGSLAAVEGLSLDSSLPGSADPKVDPDLQEILGASAPDEMIPVIVTLKAQADLRAITAADRDERLRQLVTLLQENARLTQGPLRAFLDNHRRAGNVRAFTPYWIFNGMALSANSSAIEQLASRSDVARLSVDETIQAPAIDGDTLVVEPNINLVNAPALWQLGYRGQGVVVASMDTGVYLYHPDLVAQWRGGTNSWYDPYGENPSVPVDFNGHGTRTMGVMAGRSQGGSAIGMAPEAQWIAVKIFNNQGSATSSAIHLGFQWLLDPDGDPYTADAPHVVNNSWSFTTPGCDLEFQLDLQALRAAWILPVFAAGNTGPNTSTSVSPANNPEAFAVGATDNYDQIYALSARGPSACGEAETTYPEMVAPGVNILSSDLYGTYYVSSGTSLAAPHISGGLALLLSAFPNLSANEQANVLLNSAVDLGASGADNTFGYGRLDILAAFQLLDAGGDPLPTPTLTATPTLTPTFTPTPTPTATPSPSPTPAPVINLALGKPVTVSSILDDSHNGSKSVDGDAYTTWQTKKPVGKKVLSSEWIVVDLGSQAVLNQIRLLWDVNYATSYSLSASQDNATWLTLFSTVSGDGGVDTLALTGMAARYVRMESSAWRDASLRVWLQEFEVYGSAGEPAPTPTSTPASSPTPTATPGSGGFVHVGDLDGVSSPGKPNRWNASVTITVHTTDEFALPGVSVSGVWGGGVSGSGACVTDAAGSCTLTLSDIKTTQSSVLFTVSNLSCPTCSYQEADNHDPDGDSDGTSITLALP